MCVTVQTKFLNSFCSRNAQFSERYIKQGGSNHSAVSSNSCFLMNSHWYCTPSTELMKNFPWYFFFFCCKRLTGSKPKCFIDIFSDHTWNSQYTQDKATHLGCLILSGAPQATKLVFFCGSLNISLFILSGTASGGDMENVFHARMTNRPVIHSQLC